MSSPWLTFHFGCGAAVLGIAVERDREAGLAVPVLLPSLPPVSGPRRRSTRH